MTETIKKMAPDILSIIKSSGNILLHCHPSPDPDSVGSALAMKFALESLGKKATVIGGDSATPKAFSHFPGFSSIIQKNFLEVDLSQFDLFIIQDSGSLGMISRLGEVVFPATLKTVIIDHHISNTGYAREANLVDASYPATALILFDLFKEWGIVLTPQIASDLFIGAYTDTGGFRYRGVTSDVFAAIAELTRIVPDFADIISQMENSQRPQALIFQGLALSNIQTFKIKEGAESYVAIAAVTEADLKKNNIGPEDDSTGHISSVLKSVVGWDVGACCIEAEGKVKVSFRTRNPQKYDLSVLAVSLGGGGHKSASGAVLAGTLEEAKQKIVSAVRAMV